MALDLLHVRPGLELPARTVHVDRERLVAYAEASGDHNPIHQDEEFARSVGLPDVIAHGMWTMGAAVEVVSAWAGDPTAVVSYGTRFVNPVVVPSVGGADVDVSGVVTKVEQETGRVTVELTVTCAGTKVLGRATAVVQAPVPGP
jgi:acyl dehydratase